MTSPFAFAANATLTFNVPSNATTTDKYNNVIPVYEQVEVICLLKPSTTTPEVQPGIDENVTPMAGFLVDPLELPTNVKSLTKAIAKIKTANGVFETGEFTLLKTIQNPFVMAANVDLVNRIRGTFRLNK